MAEIPQGKLKTFFFGETETKQIAKFTLKIEQDTFIVNHMLRKVIA